MTGNRIAALLLALVALAGCQPKMRDAGKITPLQEDSFFADGSSARPEIAGTVPRSDVRTNAPFFTGRTGGGYAAQVPFPVDGRVLADGKAQYGIYCAVCHGAAGAGDGMVVRRGFTKPAPFTDPALLRREPGYFFSVMTEGFRTMDTYRDLVDERGRWAIAAYIRSVLQGREG